MKQLQKKGSVFAHHVLAVYEKNMNIDKSIKHLKKAASAGYQPAMNNMMKAYKDNKVSKEELTQTLRAFQVSNDLTKSKDRDDARLID